MLIINIPNPKEKVIIQEKKRIITSLTVLRMIDIPGQKQVKVAVKEFFQPIVLWSGDAYDNIGQWTDEDVEARLIELYS